MSNTINVSERIRYYNSFIKSVTAQISVDVGAKSCKNNET